MGIMGILTKRKRNKRQDYFKQKKQLTKVLRRAGRFLMPVLPMSTTSGTSDTSGQSGRPRGRPKGSVKYPGGIYQWRKVQRAAKAQARYQGMLQRARAIQSYPQMEAQRQYNQQVQMQQVPQEQVYEQPQQVQQVQQYPQMQQQYPQQVQQREIITPFKGSGGHPYKPLNQQPLAPANSNPNFVETVDMFTGERTWKKILPSEAWTQ